MATTKNAEDASMQNALTSGEPITHFFYEYQGERSVDPSMLVKTGIAMWHEHIYTNESHDNSPLWELAESLLEARQDTPMYSWVEWLRYRITTGDFVPEQWDNRKAYPYKGLLVSAIYFQEARRLCLQGNSDRTWHIITMAYYHLGLNTAASTTQNTSRAAQMMHARRTEKLRALVLAALDKIKNDQLADSVEGAKDKVIMLLHDWHKRNSDTREWIDEFDASVSKETKERTEAKQKNDVFDRIRNLLDTWSLPSGPYLEISESFSRFSKRKRKVGARIANARVTNEEVPVDESDCYLRLVNIFEEGQVMTVKLSREEAA